MNSRPRANSAQKIFCIGWISIYMRLNEPARARSPIRPSKSENRKRSPGRKRKFCFTFSSLPRKRKAFLKRPEKKSEKEIQTVDPVSDQRQRRRRENLCGH